MTVLRTLARPLLASMFVYGGVNALRHASAMGPKAEPVADALGRTAPQLQTSPTNLVRVNGAVHVVAGAALATGHFPRLSAAVLAGTLVPTTAVGHPFWNESDPASRQNQTIHFLKNVSLIGHLSGFDIDIADSGQAGDDQRLDSIRQGLAGPLLGSSLHAGCLPRGIERGDWPNRTSRQSLETRHLLSISGSRPFIRLWTGQLIECKQGFGLALGPVVARGQIADELDIRAAGRPAAKRPRSSHFRLFGSRARFGRRCHLGWRIFQVES